MITLRADGEGEWTEGPQCGRPGPWKRGSVLVGAEVWPDNAKSCTHAAVVVLGERQSAWVSGQSSFARVGRLVGSIQ